MQLLKISVKPLPYGKTSIRLQGRDDAGNILDSWVTANPGADIAVVIQDAVASLETVATSVTEEEDFNIRGQ